MNLLKTFALFAAWLLILAASSPASADIIAADNLNLSVQQIFGAAVGFTNSFVTNRHVAQGFVSTASGNVSTIEINLGKLTNPNPPLLDVEIYTDVSGAPGALLGSAQYDFSIPEVGGIITFDFSSANVAISSAATYYLVLGTPSGGPTGISHWGFYFLDLGVLGFKGLESIDGGTSYVDPVPSWSGSELPLRISVIPEPVSLSMLALGGLVLMRRKRK